MNTDLFAQLPNWVNFVAFPVLSWIALAVVRFLLHKYRKVLRIEDVDCDVVDSATQNIMSGAYVVMGFVLVLVMATASDVDGNVAKEASQIVSLDGMLGMDASSAARSAQGSLREYASSVVNDEWKCLRHGSCLNFCVRGAEKLVHGGGRRLRRTTDAVGKLVPHVTRQPS